MTQGAWTIRPATPEDAGRIADLWRRMAEQHHAYDAEAWDFSPSAAEDWRADFAERVTRTEMICLVAAAPDGRLAGFTQCCVRENPPVFSVRRKAEVWDLVVHPDFRRQGVGRRLMEATFDALREAGCGEVSLHVAEANCAAAALYESLGMRPIMKRMYKRL